MARTPSEKRADTRWHANERPDPRIPSRGEPYQPRFQFMVLGSPQLAAVLPAVQKQKATDDAEQLRLDI